MIIHGTAIFISRTDPNKLQGMVAGPKYIGGNFDGLAKFIYDCSWVTKIFNLIRWQKLSPYYHFCFVPNELLDEYKMGLQQYGLSATFRSRNHAWQMAKVYLDSNQATMLWLST